MATETFTQVAINQADGAGTAQVLAGTPSRVARVRYLCIALSSNGTIQIKSGSTALTGAIPVLASVPLVIDMAANHERDVALAAPSGGGIDIVTTQPGYGFVVLSTN